MLKAEQHDRYHNKIPLLSIALVDDDDQFGGEVAEGRIDKQEVDLPPVASFCVPVSDRASLLQDRYLKGMRESPARRQCRPLM